MISFFSFCTGCFSELRLQNVASAIHRLVLDPESREELLQMGGLAVIQVAKAGLFGLELTHVTLALCTSKTVDDYRNCSECCKTDEIKRFLRREYSCLVVLFTEKSVIHHD